MTRITQHGKLRLVQRDDAVENYSIAKRVATIAWRSGKTIGLYSKYPKFFSYLTNKKSQSNTCSIRIYKDNIYIWRGKNRTLVTCHPIPDRYREEMDQINSKKKGNTDEIL